jgi:plastocyanin
VIPAQLASRTRLPTTLVLLAAIGLLLASAVAFAPPVRAGSVVMIDVSDFAYQPQTITIQAGDTIQWNNNDGVDHTATSVSGAPTAFDVYLAAGAWGSQTFDTPGTYNYYCIPHPFMTGTIVVQPAPTSGGGSSGGGSVPDVAMSRPADGGLTAAAGVVLLLVAAGWGFSRWRRSGSDD